MKVGDLKKYKDTLYTALCRDLSDFEKNFLLISSGILAFSITFIKDIVNIDHAVFFGCLFGSWILIGIAVSITIFTFIKSAYTSDKLWFCVDDFLVKNQKYNDENELTIDEVTVIKSSTQTILNASKSQLKTLRYIAICSFLSGIVLLGSFVGINIQNEAHKPKAAAPYTVITINKKNGKLLIDDTEVNLNVDDSVVTLKRTLKPQKK